MKLNLTDVRIGNWVKWRGMSTEIKLWFFAELFRCGNDACIPIPLSVEWLERFGFTIFNHTFSDISKFRGGVIYKVDGTAVVYHNGRFHYIITLVNENGGTKYVTKYIQYVHQLQNIVFVLEDVELEVNK